MRKTKIGIVGAAIFMAALVGCYAVPAAADKSYPKAAKIGELYDGDYRNISYFKDNENGNICYVLGYDGGISCVPMKETYNEQR